MHQIHRWLFYGGTPDKHLNEEKNVFSEYHTIELSERYRLDIII